MILRAFSNNSQPFIGQLFLIFEHSSVVLAFDKMLVGLDDFRVSCEQVDNIRQVEDIALAEKLLINSGGNHKILSVIHGESQRGILLVSQQLCTAKESFSAPDETSHMLTVPRVLRLLPSLFQRCETEALRIQPVRETLPSQTRRIGARSHRSVVVAARPVQFNQFFNEFRIHEWAVRGYPQNRI